MFIKLVTILLSVRFGHRAQDTDDLNDLYIKSRSEGFGDEVKNVEY